ncbi:MAG: hypothetical protein MUD10_05665 [Candidatus Pacebacteria bacterium]|jgi:hypothetical protein|nr:hypothetical protein [Candidatus Paceibacterota bacterium]
MNNFDKNWGNAKTDIFRLEGRPEYKIPKEEGNAAKGSFVDPNMMGSAKDRQKWAAALTSAKKRGVKVRRVRVVPSPVPDYIRREIEIWRGNPANNGEELFFIETADYNEIIAGCGFNLKDFWLFDNDKLLILNYSPAGLFTGDIPIADGGMVKRYCELKQKLLKKAVPLEKFPQKKS